MVTDSLLLENCVNTFEDSDTSNAIWTSRLKHKGGVVYSTFLLTTCAESH